MYPLNALRPVCRLLLASGLLASGLLASGLLAQPAYAASLEGRVLSDSGDPLAGVDIIAYDERLNYGAATSTNDGSWSIRQLPAGRYRIRAMPGQSSVYADRFYPSEWDFCSAEAVEIDEDGSASGLDIAVPEGGRLSGTILDLGGNPVSGAAVYAQGVESRTALGTRMAETAEDGSFTLYGLDADAGQPSDWQCYVRFPTFPNQWLGGTYKDAEAEVFSVYLPGDSLGSAAEDIGEFALLDGIRIAGVVYGPDGAVDAGTAFVYASSQVITSAVGADGVYEADGLPPGDVISWASVEGLATTYWPGSDRPTTERVAAPDEGMNVEGIDLDLPAETVLTLHFSAADGEGVGDLGEVSALLYNDAHTVGRGGPVDDDGTMVIDGLWPGTYDLYVYGSDGGFEDGYAFEGTVLATSTDVDVPLQLAASITGRLTDDAGDGVYGGYVYAFPADDPDRSYAAVADSDGYYALLGLPDGFYTVRASYVHYCPSDQGYVTVWWQEALSEEWATQLQLGAGQAFAGADFHLAADDDHDAMGDAWEQEHGLDSARDDAAEDLDDDGFSNLDEYLLGTDPNGATGGIGGCKGCATAGAGSAPSAFWAGIGLAVLRRRAAQPSKRGRKSQASAGTGTP